MLAVSDPTFTLLLATIRAPADARRPAAIRLAAARPIDWDRLLALANRHRVGPLAVEGLLAADVAVPETLAASLIEVGRRALFAEMELAGEVARLSRSLGEEGVAVTVLKGPALSLRAFGRLGLRTYRDLDFLVRADEVETAQKLLADQGYVLAEPAMTAVDRHRWMRDHKDLALRHHRTGLLVELHWRLFDNRWVMPVDGSKASIPLAIAPLEQVLALPAVAEMTYLCLHGALHGWARLRWLADVNAIVVRESTDGLLAAISPSTGRIAPATAQALILCRDLLGANFPPHIDRLLNRSRRGRLLAGLAWREIIRSGTRELEAVSLGSTIKNLSHYAMLESPQSILEEMRFDLTASRRT